MNVQLRQLAQGPRVSREAPLTSSKTDAPEGMGEAGGEKAPSVVPKAKPHGD